MVAKTILLLRREGIKRTRRNDLSFQRKRKKGGRKGVGLSLFA